MRKLTPKQKLFCEKYIELGSKIEAYRQSYNAGSMRTPSLNKCAQELFKNPAITLYIAQMQVANEKEFEHTLKDSIKLDFELIDRYKKHLLVLENPESDKNQVDAAKRSMNFIGSNGFNAAMERISKKLGFYEKDNAQKVSIPLEDSEARNARIAELKRKLAE